MAVDYVNNRSNLLPGYQLDLYWGDTKCDPGHGLKLLFEALTKLPHKTLIFGASCSQVTEYMAKVSQQYNLLQISYISESPVLSNREIFHNFFRTYPSSSSLDPVIIQLLNRFGWKKIALIYQLQSGFSVRMSKLVERLRSHGISVSTRMSVRFKEDLVTAINLIKESQTRIIFAELFSDKTREVICQAYHLNMTTSKYVWILSGWHNPNWWIKNTTINLSESYCSDSVLSEALDGHFSFNAASSPSITDKTVSGQSSADWLKEFHQYQQKYNTSLFQGAEEFAPFSYDAIIAVALMLNRSINDLAKKNKLLENVTYHDKEALEIMKFHMERVKFNGITGPVAFSKSGDRNAIAVIKRLIDGKDVSIGYYSSEQREMKWNYSIPINWANPGNKTPLDGPKIELVPETVPLFLQIFLCSLSAFGILLTLSFITLNIYYKNEKVIKISSPNVNNVIGFSGIACFVSVILFSIDSHEHRFSEKLAIVHCWSQLWLFCLGFTTAYAALIAKTWRIYKIFNKTKVKYQVIKDKQLYLIIFCMVAFEIFTLFLWTVIDPIKIKEANGTIQLYTLWIGYDDQLFTTMPSTKSNYIDRKKVALAVSSARGFEKDTDLSDNEDKLMHLQYRKTTILKEIQKLQTELETKKGQLEYLKSAKREESNAW
ncbi:uncharacterized protein TRIADDRAFT_51330 [Trichoplax adhaerens]|uniref:Gamma-aminobutyric acid type B receptor subunit 2 n=1 Tax=Trichoplax adhaerens TaxID=10228 RepID=B3RII5_TRIAD|nr:hypothetical protein TRIADDRAFT_51330 [Trichoplax adhaerens]EDV28428.1 hypothetical protein TRIADDRAFT_51330 [Trichoplax adhaerens]|eukprot:XP_002107630.1 hypothetical protein TRIADDRAFT_51330 [Trichoplax adhaerens]